MNSKRKGTRFEALVCNLCKQYGWEAYRVPLSGAAPGFRGDVVAKVPNAEFRLTFEAKAVHRLSERVKLLWDSVQGPYPKVLFIEPELFLLKFVDFLTKANKEIIWPTSVVSTDLARSVGNACLKLFGFSDALVVKEIGSQRDAFCFLSPKVVKTLGALCQTKNQ